MSEENGDNVDSSTTIETKWGKISGKRTSEIIAIFSLCIMAVGAYAFYKHEESTKEDNKQFREVVKEGNSDLARAMNNLATATQGQVREQRVMNCLLTVNQGDRRQALAECERVAR